MRLNERTAVYAAATTLTLFIAGCGASTEQADNHDADGGTQAAAAGHDDHDHGHDHGHNLHGWWCSEHGVPEGECARCDASLIAGFKEKDDWCEEHNRPDSQCFLCDPKRAEKFIARYEAKFGEKPPEPTE